MMAPSMLPVLFAVSLASLGWSSPARCQWAASIELGSDRFWGGSIENSGERRSFRPYRPTTLGIGLERRSSRLGLGLRLRYTAAGMALEGEGAVAVINGVFDVYSVSPEVVYRLAVLGAESEVQLRAGPLFEVWNIIDEESRTLLGAQAGLSLRVPLGGRFAGLVAAGAAVTPSPFVRNQLDPNFEPRALWRRGVTGRLEYRI